MSVRCPISRVGGMMLAVLMVGAIAPPTVHAANSAFQQAVLSNSPYLYYRLNETTGTVAADTSGNSRVGTYVATPTLQQGGMGLGSDAGVKFDGSTQYVSTTARAFAASLGTSSYEFVFKTNVGFPTNVAQGLFGATATGVTTAISIELNVNASGTIAANNVRFFARTDSTHVVQAGFVNATLFDGKYHHLLITYSGVQAVSVWVDGVAQTLTIAGAGIGASPTLDCDPCFAAENGRGTIVNKSAITLDEAAIYATALTTGDMLRHYNTFVQLYTNDFSSTTGITGLAGNYGVSGDTLEYAKLTDDITSTGNRLAVLPSSTGANQYAFIDLPTTAQIVPGNGNVFWISVVMNTNLPNQWAQSYLNLTDQWNNGKVYLGTLTNDAHYGFQSGGSLPWLGNGSTTAWAKQAAPTAGAGNVLMVLKIDLANLRYDYYYNPDPAIPEANLVPTATITAASNNLQQAVMTATRLGFSTTMNTANGSGTYTAAFDEVRIGTSYAAVTPVPQWRSLEFIDASTLLLRFNDLARVNWGHEGNGDTDWLLTTYPTNTTTLGTLGTYSLTGATANSVGRKTKPHSFIKWGASTKNAYEHQIFLTLASPVATGSSVTVTVPASLAAGGPVSRTITFDATKRRSEAIHVNQIGYKPAEQKLFQMSEWKGDAGGHTFNSSASFRVLNAATRAQVFSGTISRRHYSTDPDDNFGHNSYHAELYEGDFSTFTTPGTYVISVDGVGCSYPFQIAQDIYRQAYITAMRGLYYQRCGIDLPAANAGLWARAACHTGSAATTTDRYMDTTHSNGGTGPVTGENRTGIGGGWHDAGDWDREAAHMDVPSKLLLVWELAQGNFTDGELNIPESGNGIPDIVDEARWGIDYYMRMQRATGELGVGHFYSANPPAGKTSPNDTNTIYTYMDEPRCTYKFAAAAAHLAIAYQKLGQATLATTYLTAATNAYNRAPAIEQAGDAAKDADDRFHADAALFRATGNLAYQTDAINVCQAAVKSPGTLVQWNGATLIYDQTLAAWTFVLGGSVPGVDATFLGQLRNAVTRYAANNLTSYTYRGSRSCYDWYLPQQWGRGNQTDNYAMMFANYVSPNANYTNAMISTANVTLGNNPLNMCWITGLGAHSPSQIMQMNSWYAPFGPYPGASPPGGFEYDTWSGPYPYQREYTWQFTYPAASAWPPLELFFETRLCAETNEQVLDPMARQAASLGYLCQP